MDLRGKLVHENRKGPQARRAAGEKLSELTLSKQNPDRCQKFATGPDIEIRMFTLVIDHNWLSSYYTTTPPNRINDGQPTFGPGLSRYDKIEAVPSLPFPRDSTATPRDAFFMQDRPSIARSARSLVTQVSRCATDEELYACGGVLMPAEVCLCM